MEQLSCSALPAAVLNAFTAESTVSRNQTVPVGRIRTGRASTLRLVTINQFVHMERPGLSWIVPTLIPRPSMLGLVGKQKGGKSFFAIDVARRISQGEPVLGIPSVQTKCLYLMTDAREMVWRETLKRVIEAGHTFNDEFVVAHPDEWMRPMNVLMEDARAWVRSVLQAAQPGFVVLDVFREIHNADENDSTAQKIVGDYIEKLFKDVALLIVHHTKKIPEEVVDPDPARYSRGSNYLMGKVDAMWMLHGGVLKIDGRFDEVRRVKGRQGDGGIWTFDLAEQIVKNEKVLRLCNEFPLLSHGRIASIARERFNLSRATYYRAIEGILCCHVTGVVETWDIAGEKGVLTFGEELGNFFHESGNLMQESGVEITIMEVGG